MRATHRLTSIAAAATVGAVTILVLVASTAPAAPSKKLFQATVDVADSATLASTPVKLRLMLTNNTRSNQTLGSANFTPGSGVDPTAVVEIAPGVTTDRTGWAAELQGDVVAFRSTSNALKAGESVYADVNVTLGTGCTAGWTSQAKQSNDFSGAGNDFSISSADSNLLPLGSFLIDPVETVVPAEPDDLHVSQILVFDAASPTETTETVHVTARDICGAPYVDYGSSAGSVATFVAKPDAPARLAGQDLSITWVDGTATGTATLRPNVVETGDYLVLTDVLTSDTRISAASNVFDVVEKLCTSLDTTCQWQGKQGKIIVDATAPPAGSGGSVPSLGIGFFDGDLDFACGGGDAPVGETLININPRDYPQATHPTITIALTYKKSVTGSGPASGFTVCTMKDYGQPWMQVGACPSSTPPPIAAPCFLERKRTNGGDLLVVLFLKSKDPWGGIS